MERMTVTGIIVISVLAPLGLALVAGVGNASKNVVRTVGILCKGEEGLVEVFRFYEKQESDGRGLIS